MPSLRIDIDEALALAADLQQMAEALAVGLEAAVQLVDKGVGLAQAQRHPERDVAFDFAEDVADGLDYGGIAVVAHGALPGQYRFGFMGILAIFG